MKYRAQERAWVMKLLARLTPDQRRRYEEACRTAPREGAHQRLFDGEKARIAERILYEESLGAGSRETPPNVSEPG